MAKRQREPVLAKHTRTLFSTNSKKNPLILKDHPQIPVILDTLSRKEKHHIFLQGSSSDIFNVAFLESIALRLTEEQTPKILRDAYFFYLDIASLALSRAEPEHLEQDLAALYNEISAGNKRVILALNQIEPLLTAETDTNLACIGKFIKSILTDEKWRFIIITNSVNEPDISRQIHFNHFFHAIKLNEPNAIESLAVLKTFHRDLEDFHHVVIPQETFSYTLNMANHYLGGEAILEKALQLLDSGAARTSTIERDDPSGKFKPVLTNTILANVVSSWTQIPLSHLQGNKFKASDFVQSLQHQIFGQESALSLMGLVLQYARMKLQSKAGPLCSFLLVGPPNVGKKETAYAMAEQLFGNKNALLHINLDKTQAPRSLSDLKVIYKSEQNRQTSLLAAIQQTPYAVVLLENINHAPPGTIDLFQDIMTQGYALDHQGNKYDFRHAIVVITTTLGADRIASLNQPQPADLMQLVLDECSHDAAVPHQQYLSQQELCEEVLPALEPYFSSKLLHHLNIIPFVPLDYTALEKIIRSKIKALAKQLDSSFGIELNYAPEVIRFLVQESLWRGKNHRPVDKILEQHLYFCVTHEVLLHMEDKNRSNRLSLQLNDSGQFLLCEFASQSEAVATA
jgi:ATP-dependent Clp protease ATP-binding subunit ClpA